MPPELRWVAIRLVTPLALNRLIDVGIDAEPVPWTWNTFSHAQVDLVDEVVLLRAARLEEDRPPRRTPPVGKLTVGVDE